MQIYLVGGAVRDELLSKPIKEKDWVVVGSTPKEMLAKGFKPVGKDFPVFLHPETKEEYALARTEKKVSPGYTGFQFNTSPSVTLEEDLSRRDLTINAIAQDSNGKLIDPFNGISDLNKKILRHVSAAFIEDPVRLLRIARFAARLPEFTVAEETNELLKTMVNNGEVNALVAERVWQEFYKALSAIAPQRFFEVLIDCNALTTVFPGFIYDNISQQTLLDACNVSPDPIIRFAALLHQTPSAKQLAKRLKAPKEFIELTDLVQRNLQKIKNLSVTDAEASVDLLETVDAFRRPQRFKQFLQCILACLPEAKSVNEHLLKSFIISKPISINNVSSTLTGKAIADAIHQARVNAISNLGKNERK